MRVTIRRLAFGLLLVPLIGMGAVAQLPPIGTPGSEKKLKADVAALAGERKTAGEDSLGVERTKLRADLLATLKRIESLPAPGTSPRPSLPDPIPKPKSEPVDGTKPVDTLRRAMNLFRDNDFDAALSVFRQLGQDLPQLSREDRVFVRYMTASCLRRLNKLAEAQTLYREAAEMAQQDEFFAECAIWQLSLMRSNQELEAQLGQLRARPKLK